MTSTDATARRTSAPPAALPTGASCSPPVRGSRPNGSCDPRSRSVSGPSRPCTPRRSPSSLSCVLHRARTEEAARLLAGYEDHPAAAHVLAALHLARGENATATSILHRRLRELDQASLRGAALLELLAEAEIAQGSFEDG